MIQTSYYTLIISFIVLSSLSLSSSSSSLPYTIDNTTNQTKNNTLLPNYDHSIGPRIEVKKSLHELLTRSYEDIMDEIDQIAQLFININETDKNFCTPNIKSSATNKEKLLAFIEGPCSPVIIVPGITATKLQLTIDCPTLRDARPEIFEACGWSSCDSWWGSPSPEYTIWIPNPYDPMSWLWPHSKSEDCFAMLMHEEYESNSSDIFDKYKSPPGVNITWWGNTPQTSIKSRCGFEGIENLLPLPYQNGMSAGYYNIRTYLEYMGYQTGLSLFALPYHWCKNTLANELSYSLYRTVKFAYKLTGKKVIILAHSMGNLGAIKMLNDMTSQEKEEMIQMYHSITPPFLGTTKTLKFMLGGNDEYRWYRIGLNVNTQKKFFGSCSSVLQLIPRSGYFKFIGEKWYDDLIDRMLLEQSNLPYTQEGQDFWNRVVEQKNYSYSWFPTPAKNCSAGLQERYNQCGLYLEDMTSIPVSIIQGQSYYAREEDLIELLETFSMSEHPKDFINDALKDNIRFLKNPEVPMSLVYGSHLSTDIQVNYEYDPRNLLDIGDFAFPNSTLLGQGDGTVPSVSSLLPGLKWAWEYENRIENKHTTAKPIKIVEWCSTHNIKSSPYDDIDEEGEFINVRSIKNIEYIGLPCTCNKGSSTDDEGSSCNHSTIINDQPFVDFFVESVKTYDNNPNIKDTYAYKLSEEDIDELVNTCPTLRASRDIYDIFENM